MLLGGWPVYDADEIFKKEWVERTKKMLKLRRFLVWGLPLLMFPLSLRFSVMALGLNWSVIIFSLCIGVLLYACCALAIIKIFIKFVGDAASCDSMSGWFYLVIRHDRFCLITNEDNMFCATKGEKVIGVHNEHEWTHTWDNQSFADHEYRIKLVSSFTVGCDSLTAEGLNYIKAYCLKKNDAGRLLRTWIDTVVHFTADGEIWVSQKDLDDNPFGFRNVQLRLKSMKLTKRECQKIFEIR